ncbi:hypothetical protein PVAP13_4NG211322 [Panicum virgatum]|uniref:Uncharacterized protein n=1 Tax=Panicum virgatum TaxID=38727 RepID=A0A8T0T4Q1_PANVG|nr:hypothetical protein PVAP13_4NG211322 [Panicum virgatum]
MAAAAGLRRAMAAVAGLRPAIASARRASASPWPPRRQSRAETLRLCSGSPECTAAVLALAPPSPSRAEQRREAPRGPPPPPRPGSIEGGRVDGRRRSGLGAVRRGSRAEGRPRGAGAILLLSPPPRPRPNRAEEPRREQGLEQNRGAPPVRTGPGEAAAEASPHEGQARPAAAGEELARWGSRPTAAAWGRSSPGVGATRWSLTTGTLHWGQSINGRSSPSSALILPMLLLADDASHRIGLPWGWNMATRTSLPLPPSTSTSPPLVDSREI